jgi:phosphoribosylamine--glycine ligase
MTREEYDAAVDVVEATVDALEGYKGVLYGQFMLTADGPKVVEFNARLGDPEAMNTLPVMETPLLDVVLAARDGDPLPELAFADRATVCKYAVPEGYPTDPRAGTRLDLSGIGSGAAGADEDSLLFYASVDAREDGVFTTTSRSFAVVGLGADIETAEERAEAALATVDESGLRVRHDIGTRDLVRRRIDHVRRLRGERAE